MENTSTFLDNDFTPDGRYPLTLPASDFFYGVDTTESRITGGRMMNVVTPGATLTYYVSNTDVNNTNDPLRGKWVFRRDVPIYSKVVIRQPGGRTLTSYAKEKISIRGAPLFAHAIFYNMDMELAAGAAMNIHGPVHVNGDMYVSSQGSTANFYSTVTLTGNIYHAWKSYRLSAQGQTNSSMTSGEALNMTADVTFKNRLGAQISLDATGTWKDSTMGFSTTVKTRNASGTYTSQAQYDAALEGAALTNAQVFRVTNAATYNGNLQTSVNGVQNYTPVAIGRYVEDFTPTDGTDQSVNSGRLLIEPPVPSASAQYNNDVEEQKYSNKAGIYITVTPASGTTSSVVSGATVTAPVTEGSISISVGGPPGTGTVSTFPSTLVSYKSYRQSTTSGNTTVTGGMYDQRQGAGMDLVELDLTKLKAAVTEMQVSDPTLRNPADAIMSLETSHWTGIVYIEVVGGPTTNLNGSTVASTATNRAGTTAVRLINGNLKVPTYGSVPGLTVATNAPVYVKGHWNATGTAPSASVPASGELPAAIAGDAITFLSPTFSDASSRRSVAPAATGSVEVAAALLTGTVTTGKNGVARMSGGAHNLPRFVENWTTGSRITWIRGSLVCLFESRVATAPWKIDYYSAPTRNWGFSTLFLNGTYPPGTPKVISYRRADYTDLTAAEYAAEIAANTN
jgi:hypothetical protein